MRSTRILTLLIVTLSPFLLRAQEQNKEVSKQYLEQATLMIEGSQAYDDVRDVMVQAADADTTNFKANFDAGDLHLKTVNKSLASKYFMRVYRQDPEYRFDLEYWIGFSYQLGMEFDKAIEFYNRYKARVAKKPTYQGKDRVDVKLADRRIEECENGRRFVAAPRNYSITNIGREINSEYEDFGPVLNETEDEMVFTTRRRDGNTNENVADDNKPYEDIFYSKKVNGVWSPAKSVGTVVNSKYNESSLALSPDGNTLFIYRDEGNGDIYFSERQADGLWSEPEALPGIINSSYREASVSITRDENTLYFSSERPGGLGGSDIYVCTKDEKGEWSRVKNLGPTVNTPDDEDGPFIDQEGKTLYFSSAGRGGMGGFDIYKSTLIGPEKTEWSEPENLGYPINTPDDDIYYVASKDGQRGYYASVRDDGMGYTDIYVITIAEEPAKAEPVVAFNIEPEKQKEEPATNGTETTPVTPPTKTALVPLKYVVQVVDAATGNALDARVRLQGAKDNVVPGMSSQGTGVFAFQITAPQAKDYRLSVEREGYVFQNLLVRLEGAQSEAKTVTRTVELRRLSVGVSSILRNIYFDFGKASFKSESYNELNKLLSLMQQNSGMSVEIAGHTDAVGTKTFNKTLSQLRANAVKNFLVDKGIDARRVTAVGYGEDRPLASNDDESDGRELNRRVEFKVLGK